MKRKSGAQAMIDWSNQASEKDKIRFEKEGLIPLEVFTIISNECWGGAFPISWVDIQKEVNLPAWVINLFIEQGFLSVYKDANLIIPKSSTSYGLFHLANEIHNLEKLFKIKL